MRRTEDIVWHEDQNLLVLNFTSFVGHSCVLYVTGWDGGVKWWCETGSNKIRDDFLFYEEPGMDLTGLNVYPAVEDWQNTFPKGFIDKIRYYGHFRMALLRICSNVPEAADLLYNNPNLLYLIWEHAKNHNVKPEVFRQYLDFKQQNSMTYIGLQGSKSSVKLLRKVHIADFGAKASRLIMNVFQHEHLLKKMTHYERQHAYGKYNGLYCR